MYNQVWDGSSNSTWVPYSFGEPQIAAPKREPSWGSLRTAETDGWDFEAAVSKFALLHFLNFWLWVKGRCLSHGLWLAIVGYHLSSQFASVNDRLIVFIDMSFAPALRDSELLARRSSMQQSRSHRHPQGSDRCRLRRCSPPREPASWCLELEQPRVSELAATRARFEPVSPSYVLRWRCFKPGSRQDRRRARLLPGCPRRRVQMRSALASWRASYAWGT